MNAARRKVDTPEDVIDRVLNIADMAGDDELAHSSEDDLHVDVLRAIAQGTEPRAASLAVQALATLDIEFARWSP